MIIITIKGRRVETGRLVIECSNGTQFEIRERDETGRIEVTLSANVQHGIRSLSVEPITGNVVVLGPKP